MRTTHISLGVIIGIVLIFYWWTKDHPSTNTEPAVRSGSAVVLMAA